VNTPWQRYLCVALLGLALASAHAQVRERSTTDERSSDPFGISSQLGKEGRSEPVVSIPLEGVIDPAKYVVGPSDVLQVGIWGVLSFTYPLSVTPEGTLIVPSVGEIRVAEKKLVDVKRDVISAAKKKYPVADVSVTLLRPRAFLVTLRGSVLRQGQYTATSVDRVEKILREGAQVEPLRPSAAIPTSSTDYADPMDEVTVRTPVVAGESTIYEKSSTRNIKLIRKNGDTLRVDIQRFYATGNDRLNPTLLDGDIVFVPVRDIERNFVTIYGAVNAPGRYEYADGDSLHHILEIAQGVRTGASIDRITIFRQDENGRESGRIFIDHWGNTRVGMSTLPVNHGDRIIVYAETDQRVARRVLVLGEVKHPGSYPLFRGGTRLASVIGEAGGISDLGNLKGAVVLRKTEGIEKATHAQLGYLRYMRSSYLTPADTAYFFLDTEIGRHPVVVDFEHALNQQDTANNIELLDKDIIFVPQDNRMVLVRGQVANPGYIGHVPGAPLRYYIARAGGYSEHAIEGDTRVIKQSTLEWVDPDLATIDAGDQIWVPKKPMGPMRDTKYYFELARDVASIVGAIATTIILAIQVTKQ